MEFRKSDFLVGQHGACRFCVVELLDSLFLLPCTFQLSRGCSVVQSLRCRC